MKPSISTPIALTAIGIFASYVMLRAGIINPAADPTLVAGWWAVVLGALVTNLYSILKDRL